MASNDLILDAFREHLIAAGLVRRPSTAGAPRPCYIAPPEGAVAAGDKSGVEADSALVLSLFMGGDLAEAGTDAAYRRRAVVDVHYRSSGAAAAERELMQLDAAVRALFTNQANYGLGFVMGTTSPVFVRQASVWAGLGPIARGAGIGAHYVAKYGIETAP